MERETQQNFGVQQELRVDNVLSSQPELGPTAPDGGYGWVIVIIVALFKLCVPSIIIAYGIFILFLKIEEFAPNYPMLWETKFTYVPLFYIVTYTIFDPCSRKLIIDEKRPKFVSYSGVCLLCAGFLILWLAMQYTAKSIIFIFSGIFTGIGSAICHALCDILLSQYFRLKLQVVTFIVQIFTSLGFILTPMFLGDTIMKDGVLSGLLWYQLIMVPGSFLSLFIKSPNYLKNSLRHYNLIQGVGEDDEEVIFRSTTELSNKIPQKPSKKNNTNQNLQENSENTNTQQNKYEIVTAGPSVVENELKIQPIEIKKNWESFQEESTSKKTLRNSFDTEHPTEPERNNFEDNFVQPIFNEILVNNNTSYSYDVYDHSSANENPMVFMPVNPQTNRFREDFNFMRQPTFYKSLLQIVTMKYSAFIFFSLFPSYLYDSVEKINANHVSYVMGLIGISSLIYTILASALQSLIDKNRAAFLAGFCWMGSLGYIVLSIVTDNFAWYIIGGLIIFMSYNALEYIGEALLKLSLRGETNRAHFILCIFSSLLLLLLLPINISYKNCFRLMAILQFLTGLVWFANFVYKKQMKGLR